MKTCDELCIGLFIYVFITLMHMSSLREFSPNELSRVVNKIQGCLYTKSEPPKNDEFHIDNVIASLDAMLNDLGAESVGDDEKVATLKVLKKLRGIDMALFGTSNIDHDDPTLQDLILSAESIHKRLYVKESFWCFFR
mgnify:CR=1 FL=1